VNPTNQDVSYKIEYRGHLCPERIYADSTFKMRVELFNASDFFLSSEGSIYFSYRWLNAKTEDWVEWGPEIWTPLDNPIAPDMEGILYPLVKAPLLPGEYFLEFDFIHDNVTWFHEKSFEVLRIPLQVIPKRTEKPPPTAQKFNKNLSFFLIIGVQRSGTSVIHANLGSHPYIECLTGELKMDPLLLQGADLFTNTPCDMPLEMEIGWRELFKALTSLNRTKHTLLGGAKIAVADYFSALRLFVAISSTFPDLKIILIERKDKVAQFGSWKKAQETNIYCSTTKLDNVGKIVINEGEFRKYFKDGAKTDETLLRLSETNPFYHCYYEDISIDPNKFIVDIYRFLDVRPIKFKNKIQKLLPAPEDYISDYAEITKLFQDLKSSSNAIKNIEDKI
jgi:hypothetical protein